MAYVQFGPVSADMRQSDEMYGIPAMRDFSEFLATFYPVRDETVTYSDTDLVVRFYDASGAFLTLTASGNLQMGQIAEASVEAAGVKVSLVGDLVVGTYGDLYGTIREERAELTDGTLLFSLSHDDIPFSGWGSSLPADEMLLAGNDTVVSAEGADYLLGYAGDDVLFSGLGNDTLSGGAGDDTLNGAGGDDIAEYDGFIAGYTLSRSGSIYSLHDNVATDGTDTLTDIEHVRFADMTVNLEVQDKAAAAPAADVARLAELYVAFFNRVPDADGMSYWIDQKTGGQTIDQIAESFYSAGVLYSSLTGFSADMTDADFVNVVYRNVLGRQDGADAEGLAYWTAELGSGRATHGSLVSTILDSAHTFKGDATWGWVADLLDNKIAVARTFAIDWGLNYNTPEDSIANGMAIAAAITPTDTSAAIALIGVDPGQLDLVA